MSGQGRRSRPPSVLSVFCAGSVKERALQPYRHAFIELCEILGHKSVAAESWGSSGVGAGRESLSHLRECDLVVVIVARRYPEMTETEFHYARVLGLPVLVYTLAPSFPWPDQDTNHDRHADLKAFLQKVETVVVQEFTSVSDFRGKLLNDIIRISPQSHAAGPSRHRAPSRLPQFVRTRGARAATAAAALVSFLSGPGSAPAISAVAVSATAAAVTLPLGPAATPISSGADSDRASTPKSGRVAKVPGPDGDGKRQRAYTQQGSADIHQNPAGTQLDRRADPQPDHRHLRENDRPNSITDGDRAFAGPAGGIAGAVETIRDGHMIGETIHDDVEKGVADLVSEIASIHTKEGMDDVVDRRLGTPLKSD
jgi:hypothetical protein